MDKYDPTTLFDKAALNAKHVNVNVHLGERKFKCTICDKSYTTKEYLDSHLNFHAGIRPYACEFCDHAYTNRHALKRHKKVHTCTDKKQGSNAFFVCRICSSEFASKYSLTVHMRSHTGEKPFKCYLCPKAFTRSDVWKKHIKRHLKKTLKADKLSEVEFLGKKISSINDLNLPEHNKKYVCDICQKKFPFKSTLKVHLAVHMRAPPFNCDECSQCFTQKGSLVIHKQAHSGVRYECGVCGNSYTSKYHLKAHLKRHPKKVTSIPKTEQLYICQCKLCDEKFKNIGLLRIHQNRKHVEQQTRKHNVIVGEETSGAITENVNKSYLKRRPDKMLNRKNVTSFCGQQIEEITCTKTATSLLTGKQAQLVNSDTKILKKKKVPTATLR